MEIIIYVQMLLIGFHSVSLCYKGEPNGMYLLISADETQVGMQSSRVSFCAKTKIQLAFSVTGR